ncbi:MAG: hypothetical protein QM784_36815 [Polyangiaceae bacterium]
MLLDDLPRLLNALDEVPPELALIGRRQLRNNNSWMHNLPALAKGKARCTLLIRIPGRCRTPEPEGGCASPCQQRQRQLRGRGSRQ